MTTDIAIIGSALSGNKGAAAMLEAAIGNLDARIPDAEFRLFSMYPAEDRRLNRYPNLTIVPAKPPQLGVTINLLALLYRALPALRPLLRRRSAAIGALADAAVLLDQGGITFADGREKFLLYNTASVLPALLVGTPVVKCAQAMGPFRGRRNRTAARWFLPKMHTVVTRGRITHDHAQSLGLTNLVAGADLAFTLDLAGDEDRHLTPYLSVIETSPSTVGLAPSVVMADRFAADGREYGAEMADFVAYLTGRGHHVLLIPHSARAGTTKTHNNDLPLCRDLYGRLAPEVAAATTLVDAELPSQVLRRLIGRCDAFVTSRFHAMVSGLATTTPTLVLGWSHKYEEVLEMFDAQQWALGHDGYTAERLRAAFDRLWDQRAEVRTGLEAALPAVRARAATQLDVIVDLVGGGGASQS